MPALQYLDSAAAAAAYVCCRLRMYAVCMYVCINLRARLGLTYRGAKVRGPFHAREYSFG